MATPHSTIIIPLKLSDIACLKMLITSLFKFKVTASIFRVPNLFRLFTSFLFIFYYNRNSIQPLSHNYGKKILEHEVNHSLDGVWIVGILTQPQSSNNLIFFNTKKRKNSHDKNDSNQKRQNSAALEV